MEIISSPLTSSSFKKTLDHGSNDSELDDTTVRISNNLNSEKTAGNDSIILKMEETENNNNNISNVEIEVEEAVAFEKLSLLVPFDFLPSTHQNAAEVSVLTAETRNSQIHQMKVQFLLVRGNYFKNCFFLLHSFFFICFYHF